MNERKQISCNLKIVSYTALMGLLQFSFARSISAQITPDNTLGNSPSVVNNQNLNNLLIEGGLRNNSNLFHSFQEFNINQGQRAYFNNPQGINNIITRITGNNPSNINGVLGVNGAANLFLINPKGIIFGQGSSLDIKGSFFGSTADSINFSDGSIFSAVEPNIPQLLQINVPLGLQYGNNPAPITLQQANLRIKPNQFLGLIGGNINSDNSSLTAPGGTVQLAGLSSAGIVNLNDLKSLSFSEDTQFSDISLINKSNINVAAADNGNIFINANNFSLNDSNFRAGIKAGLGNPNAKSGDIRINATGNTTIEQSDINNTLEANSLGNGGQIYLKTNNLFLKDSKILANTYSSGNVGDLIVEADNKVELISSPSNFTLKGAEAKKGLFSEVERDATGNAGDITVNAKDILVSGLGGIDMSTGGYGDAGRVIINGDRLKIIEGAGVFSNTNNSGNAGEISIKASESIEVSNEVTDPEFADIKRQPGGIIADVRRDAAGNGGKINIETESLTVKGGAFLTTDTKGSGAGGDINIFASELVEIIGDEGSNTQLVTAVRGGATGNGGNLTIDTTNLIIRDGALINSGTDSSSNSGNLTVKASESIKLFGTANGVPSRLLAQVGDSGSGSGGNIVLETQDLILKDGGQISAGNLGEGKGGNINILVGDTVNIEGFSVINSDEKNTEIVTDETGNLYPSGIFSSSPGIGDAGNLNIESSYFNISNNAQVSVSSQQEGAAGNLNILATKKALFDNGIINADTVAGDSANISLNSPNIQLRYGSRITTNATQTATGGNINIDTLTLVALENSDITANSEQSFGGQISIIAQGIFGTQFREFLTSESDITASSELGAEFNGVVEIDTIGTDPNSGLVQLPTGLADSSQKIASGCGQNQTGNFTVVGRGGLPQSPNKLFGFNNPIVNLVDVVSNSASQNNSVSSTSLIQNTRKKIVEAQGWIVDAEGNVEFIAKVPEVTPDYGILSQAFCQAS
ncbi:MAG: S-layer family protein [Cyanobacteria bacterium J06643_5]